MWRVCCLFIGVLGRVDFNGHFASKIVEGDTKKPASLAAKTDPFNDPIYPLHPALSSYVFFKRQLYRPLSDIVLSPPIGLLSRFTSDECPACLTVTRGSATSRSGACSICVVSCAVSVTQKRAHCITGIAGREGASSPLTGYRSRPVSTLIA